MVVLSVVSMRVLSLLRSVWFSSVSWLKTATSLIMSSLLKLSALITTSICLQFQVPRPLANGLVSARPRYFCLAKRKHLPFKSQHNNNKLLWSPGPLYGRDDEVEFGKCQAEDALDKLLQFCEPVEKFFESATQIDGEPSSLEDSENGSKDCSGQEGLPKAGN